MHELWIKLGAVFSITAALCLISPAVQAQPSSAQARQITSFTIKNSSKAKTAQRLVTLAAAFQTGDIPAANRIQIARSGGAIVAAAQEDRCSLWRQDNSRKVCAISFFDNQPLSPGQSAVYQISSVKGGADRRAKLSVAAILAKTDIAIKSSDLSEAQGKKEEGTWDLLSLNYVLKQCAAFKAGSGYGQNPRCGWDVVAQGPARFGIHAFQYARRENDLAFHKWIRTDVWIDLWGSDQAPCPCSIAAQISQPNTWGPIAGGAVGSMPEGGYVFSARILNGKNLIYSLGGDTDARASAVSFDHRSGQIIFAGGRSSWVERAAGVFGVMLSGNKLPAGISAGVPYFFDTAGPNTELITDRFKLFAHQCGPTQACPTPDAPVTFGDDGGSPIKATPVAVTTPFSGFLALDETAQRFWINSDGTAMPAPPILVGHEFEYLTQKSKAVPPYLTALFGKLLAATGPAAEYFANAYYYPADLNAAGDGPGDDRIGYLNRVGAISLFMPYDAIAAQNSLATAASFSVQHMYHIDETTGFPDVFNNGPNKNGTVYPALGHPQPNQRTYPFSTGTKWLTPSTNPADLGIIYERYGVWLDASHMPAPQQAPYLKTGQPEWQAQLVSEANAVVGNIAFPIVTAGKTTYYRVLAPKNSVSEQTRGVGWARRIIDMADFFEPAGSPLAPYLHDLVADDVAYTDEVSRSETSPAEKSLGYYWNDINGGTTYQWWQDDFVFLSYGMNAWRGEYPHAAAFLKNYFYKQVISRMDPAGGVGGGGCFWAGPARLVAPSKTVNGQRQLPVSWNEFYANTTAALGGDWGSRPWQGCAAQSGGLIADGGGTNPSVPNGLTSILAASAAMGAVIGIPHSENLYKQIRELQYHGPCTNCTIPLSFISFRAAGTNISDPTLAIGPLGAER